MRDVLSELTDQPFFLAKSGPQGGSDVRDRPANFLRVGLEAKRYQKGTYLALDQLKSKINEAAHEPTPLDFWVLASTREISITDREGLQEVADRHGLKVIVWDWPSTGTVPPSLAVALAAAPNSVALYLGATSRLREALESIRKLNDYDKILARLLSELREPDVGYVSAASASRTWLKAVQSSPGTALAHLRGHHDLRRPDAKVITRASISSQLEAWWEGNYPTATLLGTEGIGKTWAALSWWNALALTDSMPLTVFLPARDIQASDAENAVASALEKQTGMRDAGFWRKRLSQWKKASSPLPILIIFDGLNQNWFRRDWCDFLQPLVSEDQNGRFRVLMTCWPSWWQQLGRLAPLTPSATEILVNGFTDEELNSNLKAHGIVQDAFDKEMRDFLRVPRLFGLAIQYRLELAESGDITAERLAYEDWKHRITRGSAHPHWSDEEFKALISDLGTEFRSSYDSATISSKDLMDRIGADSGADSVALQRTVQDLIAGRWLDNTSIKHRYRINPLMAPYALGLALASQLRDIGSKEAANAVIADFVDPYRGQRLIVAVLRAAVTAALMDEAVSRDVRVALLLRWLQEQNFNETDFQAWWRLVGTDVETFCQLAEGQWLHPETSAGSSEDEVLVKGFASACQFKSVAPKLSETITKWLGWAWGNPNDGRVLGSLDTRHHGASCDCDHVTANYQSWISRADRTNWPVIAIQCEGDVSWLSHRALGLLSFIPRAPSRNAIEAWAISRSIMENPRHFDELAWVLRLNTEDEDDARDTLLKSVNRLLAAGWPVPQRAAIWLLEALGDRESLERAEKLGTLCGMVNRSIRLNRNEHPSPLDPAAKIIAPAETIHGRDLWPFAMSKSNYDNDLSDAELNLCRVLPSRLQEIFCEAAASAAARTDEQLLGLSKHVPKMVLLLPPNHRRDLVTVLRSRATGTGLTKDIRREWLEAAAILEFWGLSAKEQWACLKFDGFRMETLQGARAIISQANDEDIEVIREDLDLMESEETQHVAVEFAIAAAAIRAMKDWAPLVRLMFSEVAAVRHCAMRVAGKTGNLDALKVFIDSGWTTNSELSREDNAYGSLLLNRAAELFGDPSLLERAHPEIWGWRLQNGDESETAFEQFNAFIRDRVQATDGTRKFPLTSNAWEQSAALKKLIKVRPELFSQWFEPWLDRTEKLKNVILLNTFPLIDLAEVMIECGWSDGMRLWELLMEAERGGFCKVPSLRFVALRGQGGHSAAPGVSILKEMTSDDRLRDFATHLVRRGHTDWLCSQIEADVRSQNGGRQARGWMLLGFSGLSSETEKLWQKLSFLRPRTGWLLSVYEIAQRHFHRTQWASHWYTELFSSTDRLSAYHSFTLLLNTAEARVTSQKPSCRLDDACLAKEINAYWGLNHTKVSESSKEAQRKRKDCLFGLPTMVNTHAPWI